MEINSQQLQQIIAQAPPGVSSQELTQALLARGHTLAPGTQIPGQAPVDGAQLHDTGSFLGNLGHSAGSFLGGIGQAIEHPINTVENIGKGLFGAGENLAAAVTGGPKPTDNPSQIADSIGHFFKQRYGSLDAIKTTAYQDPIGLAADLSMFLSGAGGAVSKVGDFADAAKVADVGNTISHVGDVVNPVNAITKPISLAGGALSNFTEGRNLSPVAGTFDSALADTAKANGVDLPISSLNKSKAVQLLESMVGKGFFGQSIADKVQSAGARISQLADEVTSNIGGSTDLSSVGKNIVDTLKQTKDNFFETKAQLYDEAMSKFKTAPVTAEELPQTLKVARDYANEMSGSLAPNTAAAKFFDKISEGIKKGTNTDALRQTLKDINQKIKFPGADPVATGAQAQLRRLAATLDTELGNKIGQINPEFGTAIKQADSFYKEGMTKLNSTYGKQIQKLATTPDKIVPALINAKTSLQDIPKIMDFVGADGQKGIQAALTDSIFKQASKDGTLSGTKLGNILKSYGDDKLRAILSPEQFQSIKNIEELSKALDAGTAIAKGSQTAFLGKMVGEFAILFTNPLLAIKTFLGDAFLSKFVASETGQKFLTTGVIGTGKTGRAIQGVASKIHQVALPVSQAGKISQTPQRLK